MKKFISGLYVLLTIALIFSGCAKPGPIATTGQPTPTSAASTPPASPTTTGITDTGEPSNSPENSPDDKMVLTSDPFPDSWIGTWVCTKSEHIIIEEGETVEFFDYKNKLAVTDANGFVNNWWIYYEADTNLFLFYKQDTFVEDEYWYDFEVVKQTDNEIILNRIGFGSEIVLERVTDN